MNRQPLTPRTEPVGVDGLTFRERTWLQQARKHVAELNQLLSERGNPGRYTVTVAGLTAPAASGEGR
jgi:hypothetical protein